MCHSPHALRKEAIITDAIWLIVSVVLILLALRFALLLLGANQSAGFTQFIYNVTAPFMAPFVAVFGKAQIDRSVFDWSTLLAMIVYALIGWLLVSLVAAVTPRASYESVETEHATTKDEQRVVEREPDDTQTSSGYTTMHRDEHTS